MAQTISSLGLQRTFESQFAGTFEFRQPGSDDSQVVEVQPGTQMVYDAIVPDGEVPMFGDTPLESLRLGVVIGGWKVIG